MSFKRLIVLIVGVKKGLRDDWEFYEILIVIAACALLILAFSVFRSWGVETGADLRKVLERLVQFKVFKQDAGERLEALDTLDLEEIFLERLKNG